MEPSLPSSCSLSFAYDYQEEPIPPMQGSKVPQSTSSEDAVATAAMGSLNLSSDEWQDSVDPSHFSMPVKYKWTMPTSECTVEGIQSQISTVEADIAQLKNGKSNGQCQLGVYQEKMTMQFKNTREILSKLEGLKFASLSKIESLNAKEISSVCQAEGLDSSIEAETTALRTQIEELTHDIEIIKINDSQIVNDLSELQEDCSKGIEEVVFVLREAESALLHLKAFKAFASALAIE